ncbi:MAG: rRNA maturation RNase YbeY [Aureisphaera sp.]
MIEFHSQNNFELKHHKSIQQWILKVVDDLGYELGEIDYVFCSDEYLLQLNQKFLTHDTFTDIITFDYSMGKLIAGEIYISTDRVQENSKDFDESFDSELHRVMIHGILHLCGYKDKSQEEEQMMREMENLSLEKLIIG